MSELNIEPMQAIVMPTQVMASVKVTCPNGCFKEDYLWIATSHEHLLDPAEVLEEMRDFALHAPLPKCEGCDHPVELSDGANSLELHFPEPEADE